jgi:hypothetical protein
LQRPFSANPSYVCVRTAIFTLIIFTGLFATNARAQNRDTVVTGCPSLAGNNVCYTTFQGGVSRRGFNPNETTLTQSAITATTGKTFHKLFSTSVEGPVYAQPLVLPNVVIQGAAYAGVAYVATEQDFVYAINASNGKVLWADNLVPNGYTTLDATDMNGCKDMVPSPGYIGVTGTPVIDISRNTGENVITSGILYVVARTKTKSSPLIYVQTIYAISVINGSIKASQTIAGTYANGTVKITFDSDYAHNENQRGALVAVPVAGENPQVVITWAAHCDDANFPYNGWMMAYQLNPAQNALTQTSIWTSVPSDTSYEGGIWQGASGPALDAGGHIFFAVGNGDANVKVSTPPNDQPTSCAQTPCDYGNSILRMRLMDDPAKFIVEDFFTPYDWKARNTNDYDLGSGGVMLLPVQSGGNPQNLLAQAGKEGSIYLVQTDKGYMGGYNGGDTDKVIQLIKNPLCNQVGTECGVWGAPAWWSSGPGGTSYSGYAYWGGKNLPLMQFKFYPNGNSCTGTTGAGFCTAPSAQSAHTFGWPGPTPTVSANGNNAAQGIVWLLDTRNSGSHPGGPANLWAFDAATLSCLFTTDGQSGGCTRVSTADRPAGIAVKFTVPTVANGKVFVGTSGGTNDGYLNVYGLE